MSDEERKAIEDLKRTIEYYNKRFKENEKITSVIVDNFDVNNLYILLNLIEKQQKEIEKLKQDFDIVDHECERLEKIDVEKDITINKQSKDISNNLLELQKKDKIIDLMAERLRHDEDLKYDVCKDCEPSKEEECGEPTKTQYMPTEIECVKQYFERKVEDK